MSQSRYLKNYQKFSEYINFIDPINKQLQEKLDDDCDQTIYSISNEVMGPTMIAFVLWLIDDANKNNIKKLYFLARDGLIMYKIAIEIIKEFKYDIEPKYFYCSRKAFRNALYNINKEEALNQLICYSTNTNFEKVLKRMDFSHEEISSLITEMDIKGLAYKEKLSKNEVDHIRIMLSSSVKFDEIMNKKSYKSYNNTIKYFRQEGLFDNSKFALVDSGWTGSMQKNLKILMDSKDTNIDIVGYYFGITAKVNDCFGVYKSFYIDYYNHSRIFEFNNNLFECFCSANHGMTLGYYEYNGFMKPLLDEYKHTWDVEFLINSVVELTKKVLKFNDQNTINFEKLDEVIENSLKQLMCKPLKSEAKFFGNIKFTDDLIESDLSSLSREYNIQDLIYTSLLYRVFEKLSGVSLSSHTESLWEQGSIALCDNVIYKSILKANLKMWIILKKIFKIYKRKVYNE